MPFTLAHPAAVLPLRRWCPRLLSFPALIVGSLAPDVGYVFRTTHLDEFSHTFAGSFAFCLPVGILMLALFYVCRSRAVGIFPDCYREIFLPLCRRPRSSLFVMAVSLLVGIWLHLFLDSFTHKGGWLVERVPLLHAPLAGFGYHALRVHQVLWYACSFAGIAWLWLAWERWKQSAGGPMLVNPPRVQWRNAILVAALFVPVEALHHLVGGQAANGVVAISSLLIVIWAVSASRQKRCA